jgi:hypothetical protein
MTESSNDFDSLDHQGSMFWPHVLPGNGLVTNTEGLEPAGGASNPLLTSYRERSDLTSFGTHNMFSVSTEGGSTSESTPTIAGVVGLLESYGEEAAAQHKIAAPLTNDEAVGVLENTASRISDPTLDWPGLPGDWNSQYGYGRPNVFAAMQAVSNGEVPPQGWIASPDWYSLYDPMSTGSVTITGHLAAPRSSSYHWVLEYGLGRDPTSFQTIATGHGTKPFDGALGRLSLSRIPRSFWTAPFSLSKTKELETNDQYTVTLRLRVTDAAGRLNQDRRAIAVHHDLSLLPHFPIQIAVSGEAQPALADLQGRGHLAIVFGDADGRVRAIDAATGRELPGWPASTNPTISAHSYRGINPGHEPVVSPAAVGDLFHDGRLEVVVTSTTGRVYAFDAHGHRLRGWPKLLNTDAPAPAIPRPALQYTRLPHVGDLATPLLYPLAGGRRLDIIQAAWDGHLYAWDPSGRSLPGWPVKVALPASYTPSPPERIVVHDFKLDAPPAIAYLNGKPDVVVRSQETDIISAGPTPGGVAHVFAYGPDGKLLPGFPDRLPGLLEYYGSAQEFLTEGSSVPVAADVDGSGRDEVAVGPIFSPTYLVRSDGSALPIYGPSPAPAFAQVLGFANGSVPLPTGGNLPTDTPITFTTSGAFGKFGSSLAYAQPGSGAASTALSLLLPGTGFAIKNFERAYQAGTGVAVPGYPAEIQGLDFLGAPLIAPVSGSGQSLVTAGDSSAIEGSGVGGGEVPGFPKFTTGWILWSPSAGDLLTNGHTDLVAMTREGYLMAWRTPGRATANDQWWSYHHDEWRTGRYGVDSRPPGVLRKPSWRGNRLSFIAPGDNWYAGKVAYYRVTSTPGGTKIVHPSGPAGTRQTITIPATATVVRIQAVDHAGNLGPLLVLRRAAARKRPPPPRFTG